MGVFLALLIFRPLKSDTFSGSGSSLVLMEWPHNYPDMNLIESLWYCLETMLRRQFPDTPLLGGGPDRVRHLLAERLRVRVHSILEFGIVNIIA